ncbi:MAG: hypothetical protein LBB64_02165 [Dysgonamonadaceae bacterium]|jgi:hypothetical protein|nr:hypothetical protein [Dysgonamonadaceae bacterium]
MNTTTMKRPQSIALLYDGSNVMARKTLKYILSLGFFTPIETETKSRLEAGLEEYERGEYVIINKGKSK